MRKTSRAGTLRREGFGYEGVDAGEVVADVLSAAHDEGGVPAAAAKQRLEESFDGGCIHEPDRDTRSESCGKPASPSGERVELGGETIRQPAVELLPVH